MRSRKRTSKGLLLLLVGVWSCAPDPELVYVDINEAELRSTSAPMASSGFDAEAYWLDQSVPALEGTDVLFGSAEDRAKEALDLYRETQREAAKAVLERLQSAYLNEVDLTVKVETAAADAAYTDSIGVEIDALHEFFLKHASSVEPLRYSLTQIVGFPDPDPRSLKVPRETNGKAYRRFLAARAIREEIIAYDLTFKAEVARRIALIEQAREARLASIGIRSTGLRAEALRRAQEEADRSSQVVLDSLEPSALDPSAQLPAVPGAAASVNSRSVSVAASSDPIVLRETRHGVEDQLKVFLKTYRYRRTENASLGRNVTQEFLEWRRKYTDGR